jgi:hypothetical protein
LSVRNAHRLACGQQTSYNFPMAETPTGKYYVYVYIDPRNFEEFYYGKGVGYRKNAHLADAAATEKAGRVREIKAAGLEPIIKVLARNLSESDAFLIEKTLIWKLGRSLTNISTGHFADKFRPHNTIHLDLQGFDYEHGLYYVNVGQGPHRTWDDCRRFGFLSAGQGKKWSDQIRTLNVNDIVVPYLRTKGYVGIGRVVERARRAHEFKAAGKSGLKRSGLKEPGLFENYDNENAEYLVRVEWIKQVAAVDAKWKKRSKLFTTQLVKASLERQPKTIEFLERSFGVLFKELMV